MYKPERPDYIHEQITEFTKGNVPYFFVHAKDKVYADDENKSQVEKLNMSFVNKLEYKITNPKINSRQMGLKKIDYKKLMNNPKIKCNVVFDKNGILNEELSDPMVVKYFELNNKYHFKVNMECADIPKESTTNTQMKHELFFKKIASEIRSELSQFGYTDSELTDILVKLLYHIKPSSHKSVLWFCYGKYIVDNLKKNGFKSNTKVIQCVDCGEWIEVDIMASKTCRCEECQKLADYIQMETKVVTCIDCGKEFTVSSMASKTCRCEECQKLADYTPMETKIVTCIDCGKEFEADSNSRIIRCEECLIKNNRRKRMKNYYKTKSDYIYWVDDKCFLLKYSINKIEDDGYEFESWDMMETPLINYDVMFNFVHKENRNMGYSVPAKRIFDLDLVFSM